MSPLLISVALAQSLSADPEMVAPRLGHDAVPGMHGTDVREKNAVRVGTTVQYQRNPVTGYRTDKEIGAIISDRMVAHAGLGWDFASWGTLSVVLPVNMSWRGPSHTDLEGLETNGFGVGDLTVGSTFLPLRSRFFNLGLHGDLSLPTGRKDALVGENSLRIRGGVNMLVKPHAYVDVGAEVAVVGRPILVTNSDFDLGPELWMAQSARVKLPWVPVAFTQTLQARAGFTNLFRGGGENGLEVLGGVQTRLRGGPATWVTVDVMAGRGTNQGFGTTDLRLLANLTLETGKRPRIEEIVDVQMDLPVVEEPVEEEPVVEEVEPGTVEITEDQLILDRPVEFFVDTARLKPSAIPVLRSVAEALHGEYQIQHVVIEGHASQEGDFEYNYALSTARAEAVFRQLVLEGVHPSRISFRGQGEVVPRQDGDSEEALQLNRRVEFHIVSRFHPSVAEMQEYLPASVTVPLMEPIQWPALGLVPWTGEERAFVVPEIPDEAPDETPADEQPEEDFAEDEESFEFEE